MIFIHGLILTSVSNTDLVEALRDFQKGFFFTMPENKTVPYLPFHQGWTKYLTFLQKHLFEICL